MPANFVDVSGVQYFLPILSFLLVFIITFVVLKKIKIAGNVFIELLLSFIVAVIFIAFIGPQRWVQNVTPAVVILILCAFFILVVAGLFGKSLEGWAKGFGIIFVIILFLVFIGTAFVVFSHSIAPYLPGGDASQADPSVNLFTDWIFSSRVGGAILLLIVSALVAWVLVKVKG